MCMQVCIKVLRVPNKTLVLLGCTLLFAHKNAGKRICGFLLCGKVLDFCGMHSCESAFHIIACFMQCF